MAKVMVKLLRPLLGREIGATAEYDKADAERLASYGAVEIMGEAKAEPAPENKAEDAAPANKATAHKGSKGR